MKKVRYSVDFPQTVMNLLENMAEDLGSNKADVLKQAIALYSYVNREVKGQKNRHLSITSDNKIIKDIVLLNN